MTVANKNCTDDVENRLNLGNACYHSCDKHGRGENAFEVLVRSLKGREQSEDLGVSGKTLKQTLKKRDMKVWTGLI
jgi:hypothetical protein